MYVVYCAFCHFHRISEGDRVILYIIGIVYFLFIFVLGLFTKEAKP